MGNEERSLLRTMREAMARDNALNRERQLNPAEQAAKQQATVEAERAAREREQRPQRF